MFTRLKNAFTNCGYKKTEHSRIGAIKIKTDKKNFSTNHVLLMFVMPEPYDVCRSRKTPFGALSRKEPKER